MTKQQADLLELLVKLNERMLDATFAFRKHVTLCAQSGLKSHQIADELGIDPSTVRTWPEWRAGRIDMWRSKGLVP